VDGSSSVGQQNFIQFLSLVKGTYHAFPVSEEEIRIALIVISDAGKVAFNFDKDTEMTEIDKNVDYVTFPGGKRNVGNAISTTIRNVLATSGRRGMVPQILVSILAGKSSDDITAMAKELHRGRVKSITVGVGSVINQDELRLIAGDGQNVVVNSDLSKLALSIPEIVRKINAG
jgi:hypothetical protein